MFHGAFPHMRSSGGGLPPGFFGPPPSGPPAKEPDTKVPIEVDLPPSVLDHFRRQCPLPASFTPQQAQGTKCAAEVFQRFLQKTYQVEVYIMQIQGVVWESPPFTFDTSSRIVGLWFTSPQELTGGAFIRWT